MIDRTAITSSLISSSIVALGFLLLLPSQEQEPLDADVVQHRHTAVDNIADSAMDTSANILQQQKQLKYLSTLQANHKELADWYYALEQRVSELEQGVDYDNSSTLAQASSMQNDSNILLNPQPTQQDVEIEESLLAEQEPYNRFDKMQSLLASEPHDANWQAEMENSLIEVQQRLSSFNLPQAEISRTECGDQTCLVEFVTDADVDLQTYTGLLAAQGAGEVVLKLENSGERNRILALYRR